MIYKEIKKILKKIYNYYKLKIYKIILLKI